MASSVRAVALPASASGQVGFQNDNANLTYMGFSIRETASAAAVIRIRGGGVVTGPILETVSLSSGESTSDEYSVGRNAGSGLYVQLVSGTMPEGSVFYR